MEIVKMTAELCSAAAELEKLCFSTPWSEGSIKSEVTGPLTYYVAALEGGALVGYAGMTAVIDEGYIGNICVAPEYRGRGWGEELLRELIRASEEARLLFLTLEVRASNEIAQKLYGKCGFQRVGLRRGYYEKPREDAVLMTLRLAAGRNMEC